MNPSPFPTNMADAEKDFLIAAEAKRRERQAHIEVGKLEETLEQAMARIQKSWKDRKVISEPRLFEERARKAGELLAQANLSIRHRDAERMSREGPWGDVLENLEIMLPKGFLMALVGRRWTGKTQLAHELIKVACRNQLLRAYYSKTLSFFIDLKGTYHPKSEKSEKDVIAFYRKPFLLVLDDAHERAESDWENRMLAHLVDLRYDDRKATLLISNLNPQTFSESVGPSINRRLNETGGIIEAHWPTFEK